MSYQVKIPDIKYTTVSCPNSKNLCLMSTPPRVIYHNIISFEQCQLNKAIENPQPSEPRASCSQAQQVEESDENAIEELPMDLNA